MLKVIDWSHARIQREGGGPGVRNPPPPEKFLGFPSIIDPDPHKITKLPSLYLIMGHH